jgi:hypothetical protein
MISRVDPFEGQDAAQQLDSWVAALEMTVATLNKTLADFKEFQRKGDQDVEPGEPAADDRARGG